MMEENKKVVFSYKANLNIEEWKKMFKCVPKFYCFYTMKALYMSLVASIILSLFYHYSVLGSIITFFVIFLPIALIYKIKIEWLAAKVYNVLMKKGNISEKIIIDFYDDFLIKKTDNLNIKLKYSEIKKIYETDTNIYLDSKSLVINLKKSECNQCGLDLLNKIKEQFENTDSNSSNKTFNLNNFLLIMYFLTIFSIFGALISLSVTVGDKPFVIAFRKLWLCWIWLPIPVVSLILGMIFKNHSMKSKKNIIAGFIVSICLLILGSLAFLKPFFEIEYNHINTFKEILNVDFPKDGILTKEYYETYFSQNMTDVEIYQAYYEENEELDNFENRLKSNENWMNTKEISQEFKDLIPLNIKEYFDKLGYVLIYNETDGKYNEFLENDGIYDIYVALYTVEDNSLIIGRFKYSYTKS